LIILEGITFWAIPACGPVIRAVESNQTRWKRQAEKVLYCTKNIELFQVISNEQCREIGLSAALMAKKHRVAQKS